eukprot:7383337-Prymnesium_polylepis.1
MFRLRRTNLFGRVRRRARLRLLSPENDALALAGRSSMLGEMRNSAGVEDFAEPLAHYYMACPHNSCRGGPAHRPQLGRCLGLTFGLSPARRS